MTTPLDDAIARMERSDAERLRFYAQLADAELLLLLDREVDSDDIEPRVIDVGGTNAVLAFDTETRLADFAQGPVPYAALPGRVLADMLKGHGIAMALNPRVDGSMGALLPPEAMGWLSETLLQAPPDARSDRIAALYPARGVPDVLLEALGARLSASAGLAARALLAQAEYEDGGRAPVLVIVGASARSEPALATAVSEALTFSGIDAGYLDVAFVAEGHALLRRLEAVAMRFDIPAPPEPAPLAIPGSDPDKPPRLR